MPISVNDKKVEMLRWTLSNKNPFPIDYKPDLDTTEEIGDNIGLRYLALRMSKKLNSYYISHCVYSDI